MNSRHRILTAPTRIRLLGLQVPVLLIVFGAPIWGAEPMPTPDRVESIRHEAARIDAEYQTTDTPDHYRLAKSLSHWELSGLIERGDLVYLQAIFTEGSAVREETYYLQGRRPILTAVVQWLDLEDANKAARSRQELKFFIDGDQVVRRDRRSPASPRLRTDVAPQPSADLVKRATVIARVLAGELAGRDARESLEALPEAFTAIP
jgi:hypothetical protein